MENTLDWIKDLMLLHSHVFFPVKKYFLKLKQELQILSAVKVTLKPVITNIHN